VSLVELVPSALARALEPFPFPIRTLDAVHLATAHHLAPRQQVTIAIFNDRMRPAAVALGLTAAF